jgi:3-hydroxyacyl-[acyl-carrier-protein] dehydratase
MSALPVPRTWSERTADGTHAVLRLPVDLGADYLAGHYPGYPILPGVVVMDWVQQAVDSLHGGDLQLSRIDRARFVRPLFPGDVLELTIRVRRREPNGEGISANARIVRSDRQLAVELDATFGPVGPHA